MNEYRVIRNDTGMLVTKRGYEGLAPENLHGTFSTLTAAVDYVEDLNKTTNTWWLKEYGYSVQHRYITEWTLKE